MKKQLVQLALCSLALLFVAGIARAYTPPTTAPGAGNTDGPLTIGTLNQTKTGGLSVGTFAAQKDAYFDQNTLFNGVIRGGSATSTSTTSTVAFGGANNKVDVLINGTVGINGIYQSDTLKTGGGTKPLCADMNGVIYICNTTPPSGPAKPQAIHLYSVFKTTSAGTYAIAVLTKSVDKAVTATIAAALNDASGTGSGVSLLKRFYTAEAVSSGTCRLTSTPTELGTVTIYAGTLDSSQSTGGTLSLPQGCDPANVRLTITSYSPHVDGEGRSIVGQ